jgi:dihydroflavonol-4-reductase
MSTYAVTGANGFIACNMIKHLIANGHTVRGTVRDAAKDGEHLKTLGAEVVEVKDLKDVEALAKAFAGVDGVFHMAAVHPEYGFADTPEGRAGILSAAVKGTVAVLSACKKAEVKRVVLTSSLAAIECGNDEGTLSEDVWSKAEVYDSEDKLNNTRWTTHYTYVKSKVEQEKAAVAFAEKEGLDMRVVVPGNLCIGPIASTGINGTMTRIKDIMSGKNTLMGAADLAIVHVHDVVEVHFKCMTVEEAKGRYIVAPGMAKIEDVFAALKDMYPQLPVAEMGQMDIASGVPGAARKIESRAPKELGVEFKPYQQALKDSVDSMIAANLISAGAA